MKSLMECYCELLKKVDVTIYSTQSEQQSLLNDERNVSFKRNQRPQTQREGTMVISKEQKTQKLKDPSHFIINAESDIFELLKGFNHVLSICLAKDPGLTQTSDDFEVIQREEETMFGRLRQFMGAAIEVKIHENDLAKQYAQNNFSVFIVACLNCWNSLDIFQWKDYFFTRNGILPYVREDDSKNQNMFNKFFEE